MIYDLLFFFAILIGVLLGIAGGVHVGFILAKPDDEEDDYRVEKIQTTSTRDKKGFGSEKDKEPKERKERRKREKAPKYKEPKAEKEHKDRKAVFGKYMEKFHKKPAYDKRTLKSRIQISNVAYSQFDCEFTGEDEKKKLQRVMQEQNGGYHYLEGSSKGKKEKSEEVMEEIEEEGGEE